MSPASRSRARGATILRVDPRRVYLDNEGRGECLALAAEPMVVTPPAPAARDDDVRRGVRCGVGGCRVDRALVDRALADPTSLLSSVRAAPLVAGGSAAGFKLYAIRPGSLIAALGLENGDTLKSINGLDLSDARQALEAFNRLRSASHLTLAVERRGARTTLDFTVH